MPHLCKVDAGGDGKKTPTRLSTWGVWEETGVTESKQRIDEPNKKLEEMKNAKTHRDLSIFEILM